MNSINMEVEEIEVLISGLTEDYDFIYMSDLHIIEENEGKRLILGCRHKKAGVFNPGAIPNIYI